MLYDEFYVFEGLDVRDLDNYFCVDRYITCIRKFDKFGTLIKDSNLRRKNVMKEFLKSITPADIVVVLAAIIGVINNICTNKKSNDFQSTWNQKQLDVDLKSKARIEWIQKVRNITAELIAKYYKILNETDKNKLLDEYSATKEKSELLILYFGPEYSDVENLNAKNLLFNNDSNDGKNKYIVEFLSSLSVDFYTLYKNISSNKIENLEKARKSASNVIYNNPIKEGDLLGYNYTEDGDEIPVYDEPTWDPNLQDKLNNTANEIINYNKFVNKLSNDIVTLRNIMRIYLKIEWIKAKSGN